VYPNLAEVVTEACFEERAGSRVQGLAGRVQHIVDNGWDADRRARSVGMALEAQLFLLAFIALSSRHRMLAAGALALQNAGDR
jgi:hypothetical protein